MNKNIFIFPLVIFSLALFVGVSFAAKPESAGNSDKKESNSKSDKDKQALVEKKEKVKEKVENFPSVMSNKKDDVQSLVPGNANQNSNAVIYRKKTEEVVNNLNEIVEEESAQGNEEVAEEIQEVVEEQEQTADETAEVIQNIEKQKQNKFMVALVGTDYKNLGQLRSSLAQNENQIRKLTQNALMIQGEENQVTYQEQLMALMQERERMKTILTENENTFSVLGWFFRLINNYPSTPAVDETVEEELVEEVTEVLDDEFVDNLDQTETEDSATDETTKTQGE